MPLPLVLQNSFPLILQPNDGTELSVSTINLVQASLDKCYKSFMAMALTQISLHGSNSKLRFNQLVIISTRHNSTRLPSTLNMKYNVKSKPLYLSDTSRTLFSLPFNNHGKLGMRLQSNVSSPATSISMPLELLNCWEDEYDGVVIDAHSLPSSTNAFVALLRASLSYWKLKVMSASSTV